MAQTTFFLAVASRLGLRCGRIGLTSEQANLSACNYLMQWFELEETNQAVFNAVHSSELGLH